MIGISSIRVTAAALAVAAMASLSVGTTVSSASASDPVVNITATARANCTKAIRAKPVNKGTQAETIQFVIQDEPIKTYTVQPGTSPTFYRLGETGSNYEILGPDDSILAEGMVPAQCPGGSPVAYITITKDKTTKACVAHYHLNTMDRKQAVAFWLWDSTGKFYRPMRPHRQKVVSSTHVAAGTVLKVMSLKWVNFALTVPKGCAS